MALITSRIDAVTRIPESHRTPVPPAPRSVKIELSGRCNLRCSYCSLPNRAEQPKHDMDPALFRRITREMRQAGVEEIGLFYLGESFMNPKLLVACIEYLKRELSMPYVFLTSNATLATPENVERAMEAGLDSLKWSVNACDPEQYERITGRSQRLFYRALDNIREAHLVRSMGGFKTGLYASSIQYDDEQLQKMQRLLAERVLPYVDEHYWLPLYRTMAGDAFAGQAVSGNIGRVGALVDSLPCWAVFSEGHVRVDGHLSACCFGADDRYDAGDLKELSFMEAWQGPEMTELRKAHLGKDVRGTMCEDCPAYA